MLLKNGNLILFGVNTYKLMFNFSDMQGGYKIKVLDMINYMSV